MFLDIQIEVVYMYIMIVILLLLLLYCILYYFTDNTEFYKLIVRM